MRFPRIWRYKLELRCLQRKYYKAAKKDEGVIAAYLNVLAEARREATRGAAPLVRLHVGSGGHIMEGWINLDIDLVPPVDITANAAVSLPFRTASVDRIHSEDFIEHIDADAGKGFVGEAFRVLRPGGIMRLLTPDLRAIVQRVYLGREPRHLRWCYNYLDANDACEAFNMHMRMNGEHRFIYDGEHLRSVLTERGFKVRRVRYNRSPDLYLRFLDLRDFGLNLFLECVKPS